MVKPPDNKEEMGDSKMHKRPEEAWSKYKSIVEKAEGRSFKWSKVGFEKFLEQASSAAVVVQTGDCTPSSR